MFKIMRSLRHRREQRGAVLVEFVLILPVLLLLLFGIIEFGFLLYGKHSVVQASRDGARFAATQSRSDTYITDVSDSVSQEMRDTSNFAGVTPVHMAIYSAHTSKIGDAADNDINSASDYASKCTSLCVAFNWDASAKKFVPAGGFNWTPWIQALQSACLNPQTDVAPDTIGVYVEVNYKSFTPLIGSILGGSAGKTMTSNTIMRLEPLPSDQCSS